MTFQRPDLGDEVSIFWLDVRESDDAGGKEDDHSREGRPPTEEVVEDVRDASTGGGVFVEDRCEPSNSVEGRM